MGHSCYPAFAKTADIAYGTQDRPGTKGAGPIFGQDANQLWSVCVLQMRAFAQYRANIGFFRRSHFCKAGIFKRDPPVQFCCGDMAFFNP